MQIPASLGVQGPGDRTMPAGFRAMRLVDRDLVVAMHDAARAEIAQEVDEVVGEAVVVIDQEKHGGSLSGPVLPLIGP